MRIITGLAVAGTLLAVSEGALAAAAQCPIFAPDNFVTRNDLALGQRAVDANLLLRFVHLTDEHIIDDDGQAVIGASVLDPVAPLLESAMRLQEEYTDEVFNNLIGRVNTCTRAFPTEFAIVTGDSADQTTVGEIRRFIDNLDGSVDRMSAFEETCRASMPLALEAVKRAQCTRFTGRGVADTQSPEPNVDQLLLQAPPVRTALQTAATESAALLGRAEDGSINLLRQTATRTPGLPQSLRCDRDFTPGCGNHRMDVPWYIAFGNHDGYLRGTVAVDFPANVVAGTAGRRYMLKQSDFIREFFNTRSLPGPVGHGFQLADASRRNDTNGRNDGYYAFTAGGGRMRMIVLNTIIDGVLGNGNSTLLRTPFALSDGGMDFEQFEWLKSELALARGRNQLTMVFSHHPDVSFAEFGTFAPLVRVQITAAEILAELGSYPHVIAWVAGHTHRHRIRSFRVVAGAGTNDSITTPVACKGPGNCTGFWQIETASLIDFPQEQRLIEVFDNKNGTGTIRGPILTHNYERARVLAERDDRCQFYLTDPAAVQALITEADLGVLCTFGGTRQGLATDRNVELTFRIPSL